MQNSNPIGFFDSGVGQLSVLMETKKLLPKENFVVYADQKHNPFGQKTKKQVKQYVLDATGFLVQNHKIKMMVLACNTASVLGLEYVRERFNIPIVGVVPAVKVAFKNKKVTKVAIMSTPATAKSPYLKNLIKKFGDGKKTIRVGCDGLEEEIELLKEVGIDKALDKYIVKIKKFDPEIVVLGCTHYPLVKKQIQAKLKDAKVIDSGEAIARQVKNILSQKKLFSTKSNKDYYYTSGNSNNFSKVASVILKYKVTAQRINVT